VKEFQNLVKISVSDQGIGIPEQKINKIFDKFTRLKNDDKSRSIGLGLYLVKSLIELHKGKIEIENLKEGGTKFCISLPKNII
jgi:signal transduction histidine kinase